MNNLLAMEGYKLQRNGIFRILCYFMLAMVLNYLLFAYLNVPKTNGYTSALTGIKLYANAMVINQLILKIVLGILAGFFISSEYPSGVLKRAVSAGYNRSQVYLSKLAIYSLGVVLIALLIPILTIAFAGFMTGAGLLSGFGQAAAEVSSLAYVLRTLGFTILFAAAFASIAAFMAVWLADNGKTIGTAILFFLFIDQILLALSRQYPAVKAVYDYSLFRLFTATAEFRMNGRDLLWSIVMPIIVLAVFTIWGLSIFRNKEIK